jgi:hypothetical protein
MQTSAQLWENHEVQSAFPGFLFQGSFGAQPGAGDQADLVAEQVMLIIHIEEGIFLSPSNDQPSDDVRGSHGKGQGSQVKRRGMSDADLQKTHPCTQR